jgi:hypothetical protein
LTVVHRNAFEVSIDGRLRGAGGLGAVADAVMDALIDAEAVDPFVYIDERTRSLRLDLVVVAVTEGAAVTGGVQQVLAALGAAGVGDRVAVDPRTARAGLVAV